MSDSSQDTINNNKLAYKIVKYGKLSDVTILNTFNYLLDKDTFDIIELVSNCALNNFPYISHLITIRSEIIFSLLKNIETINLNILDNLIENGLDVNYLNEDGNNCFQYFVERCIEYGDCYKCKCKNLGRNCRDCSILNMILKNGLDINNKNKQGKNCIDILFELYFDILDCNDIDECNIPQFTNLLKYLVKNGGKYTFNDDVYKVITYLWDQDKKYVDRYDMEPIIKSLELNQKDINGKTLHERLVSEYYRDGYTDDLLFLIEKLSG